MEREGLENPDGVLPKTLTGFLIESGI